MHEPAPPGITRVLFVQSATLPPLGADIWVHGLIMRHLDRARFELYAACVPGRAGAPTPAFELFSQIPGLQIVPVDLGPELFNRSRIEKLFRAFATLPAVASLLNLARKIRGERIAVLHTSDRPRDALACVLLGKLTGAKSVIQVHVEYGAWMSAPLRWALKAADALIGVSATVTRSLIASGHRAETTHTVLNAIEVAKWDPSIDGRLVRQELGIPEGVPVIACIARVMPGKGQSPLIQALADLKREAPNARLLIVGQDYPKGSGYGEKLQAQAADAGVGSQVIFTGQRRDIARVLAACDIFAMPSAREPFGLVYAEAMAMQRPVIALAAAGALEIVEHEKSGLLSQDGDAAALAKNLLRLIREPALRAQMGLYGRRVIESRFAPERQAREIEQVYASLQAAAG